MPRYKMILDLDTGIDDALALAYAVGHQDIDLIGIIASYGNNLTDVTAQNSLDLLDLLGASDVPVFYGARHSTTTDDFSVMPVSKTIHGKNGVGDVAVPKSSRQVDAKSGIDFLIEAAHQYQDELIYLPTGPLTNLALALEKDPAIAHLIGQTTLMGGALTVPGNVTPFTEANINQDPEAANTVFQQQEKLTMVGLDVTLRTLLTKKETVEWRALGNQKGQLYADIMDYYIDAYYNLDIDKRGAALHDPLAVAVAVQPDYIDTLPLNMKVTTDKVTGDYGRTIGDTEKLLDETTSKAAILVDQDRFVHDFQRMMLAVLA
ncbi:nucleoside hydrolase [Fructobacillus sp. M158]|uniref:nucleoside hydrolase n=1 Tax=Fructobacillus parabroussonetiae TaxID=2713174 RepID=UPI00200B5C3A|nr:nucleoside hydrolase [Fructobacillus parabroussonetiae]MCK8617914.1 nucleoside hydrolase [Fructobacillus parabroussonetiae]